MKRRLKSWKWVEMVAWDLVNELLNNKKNKKKNNNDYIKLRNIDHLHP